MKNTSQKVKTYKILAAGALSVVCTCVTALHSCYIKKKKRTCFQPIRGCNFFHVYYYSKKQLMCNCVPVVCWFHQKPYPQIAFPKPSLWLHLCLPCTSSTSLPILWSLLILWSDLHEHHGISLIARVQMNEQLATPSNYSATWGKFFGSKNISLNELQNTYAQNYNTNAV